MTRLLSAPNSEALAHAAADFVGHFIAKNPRALVALPTGQTPRGMYRLLAGEASPGHGAVSELRFVSLDEYVGLSPDDPRSFSAELRLRLLDPWAVAPGRFRLLRGDAVDPERECIAHEGFIRDGGGIDLAILGIGANGHIAFNEPGTPFAARAHVATLASETRRSARSRFGGSAPPQGLTLGIATILEARNVLLLASGKSKAAALAQAIDGDLDPALPASALQRHPRLTVIADADAVSARSLPSG